MNLHMEMKEDYMCTDYSKQINHMFAALYWVIEFLVF